MHQLNLEDGVCTNVAINNCEKVTLETWHNSLWTHMSDVNKIFIDFKNLVEKMTERASNRFRPTTAANSSCSICSSGSTGFYIDVPARTCTSRWAWSSTGIGTSSIPASPSSITLNFPIIFGASRSPLPSSYTIEHLQQLSPEKAPLKYCFQNPQIIGV